MLVLIESSTKNLSGSDKLGHLAALEMGQRLQQHDRCFAADTRRSYASQNALDSDQNRKSLESALMELLPDISTFRYSRSGRNELFSCRPDAHQQTNKENQPSDAQNVCEPVGSMLPKCNNRWRSRWKRALLSLVENRSVYFQSFLPHIARTALPAIGGPNTEDSLRRPCAPKTRS